MGIEDQLTTRLKEAMRAKDARELAVLRMVKTLAGKEKTASGFDRDIDDAFWLEVIKKYVKQQTKALAEFEKIGEGATEQIEAARWEIAYLAPFLPVLKSEAETEALVAKAIEETGAVGARMVGKVVGAVMRNHKDEVDAASVKRIAAKLLG